MCGITEEFSMNLWDSLTPQAELTCNLLDQSNVAPKSVNTGLRILTTRFQYDAIGTDGLCSENQRKNE